MFGSGFPSVMSAGGPWRVRSPHRSTRSRPEPSDGPSGIPGRDSSPGRGVPASPTRPPGTAVRIRASCRRRPPPHPEHPPPNPPSAYSPQPRTPKSSTAFRAGRGVGPSEGAFAGSRSSPASWCTSPRAWPGSPCRQGGEGSRQSISRGCSSETNGRFRPARAPTESPASRETTSNPCRSCRPCRGRRGGFATGAAAALRAPRRSDSGENASSSDG